MDKLYNVSKGVNIMSIDEFLTVKEAAEQLGVSDKTIRRRIAKGDLKAELKESPYGHQYFIPKTEINTAQQIIDVVKVKKEYDIQELAISLSAYLEERDASLIEITNELSSKLDNSVQEFQKSINDLKDENAKLKEQLIKTQEEHFTALDTKLKTLMESKQNKKGFFSKIFNK